MSILNFFQPIQKINLKSSLLDRLAACFRFFGGAKVYENGSLAHIGLLDILTLGASRLLLEAFNRLSDLGVWCFVGAISLLQYNPESLVAKVLIFFLKPLIFISLFALGIVLCLPLGAFLTVWSCALIAATIAVFPIILLVHGIMKGVERYRASRPQNIQQVGDTVNSNVHDTLHTTNIFLSLGGNPNSNENNPPNPNESNPPNRDTGSQSNLFPSANSENTENTEENKKGVGSNLN